MSEGLGAGRGPSGSQPVTSLYGYFGGGVDSSDNGEGVHTLVHSSPSHACHAEACVAGVLSQTCCGQGLEGLGADRHAEAMAISHGDQL